MLDLRPKVQGRNGPIANALVPFVGAPREFVLVYQRQGMNGELPDCIGEVRGFVQPVVAMETSVRG